MEHNLEQIVSEKLLEMGVEKARSFLHYSKAYVETELSHKNVEFKPVISLMKEDMFRLYNVNEEDILNAYMWMQEKAFILPERYTMQND